MTPAIPPLEDTQSALVPIVQALCVAVPPTIVAWAALWQSRLNADSAKKAMVAAQATEAVVVANDLKTDALTGKVEHVVTLANSNLSAVTTALDVAREEVKGLQKVVQALVESRDAPAKSEPAAPVARNAE